MFINLQILTLSCFKVTKNTLKAFYTRWKSTCCWSLCLNGPCDLSLFIVSPTPKQTMSSLLLFGSLTAGVVWFRPELPATLKPNLKSQSPLDKRLQIPLEEMHRIGFASSVATTPVCKTWQFPIDGKISRYKELWWEWAVYILVLWCQTRWCGLNLSLWTLDRLTAVLDLPYVRFHLDSVSAGNFQKAKRG